MLAIGGTLGGALRLLLLVSTFPRWDSSHRPWEEVSIVAVGHICCFDGCYYLARAFLGVLDVPVCVSILRELPGIQPLHLLCHLVTKFARQLEEEEVF